MKDDSPYLCNAKEKVERVLENAIKDIKIKLDKLKKFEQIERKKLKNKITCKNAFKN